MKINKPLLSFLIALALPTTHAMPGVSSAGEVNPKAAGSVDVSPAKSAAQASKQARTPLLDPSYILDGIQYAYLPSTLHMTRIVHALVEPKQESPSDFWEIAKQSEEKLKAYVSSLLEAAATYFKSTHFTEVTSVMNTIVNATAVFRDGIQGALDDRQVTVEMLTEELEGVFMRIVNDLKEIPHPDQTPGHAERTEMVNKVLNDTNDELVKLAARYGIDQEVVTTYLDALEPQVRALVVTVGDINEQYPQLLPGLMFSVAALLIPEAWILRPFLSIFGFGPAGPVKGSAAAWMQRVFWGAAVEAGSWFSWLQAAGMGVLPRWAWLITKFPLLVVSVLAMLLPCIVRG